MSHKLKSLNNDRKSTLFEYNTRVYTYIGVWRVCVNSTRNNHLYCDVDFYNDVLVNYVLRTYHQTHNNCSFAIRNVLD